MKETLKASCVAALVAVLGAKTDAAAETICLDGEWAFGYCTDESDTTLCVPANWEMHGFGKPGYGSEKSVKLSGEHGTYCRRFTTPSAFTPGCRAFLRFEGVMFGARVQVNGLDAGEFRSSFNRNMLDVTPLLNPADEENTLLVRTLANPKGGAFDTNDDWTLHGIFRSVFLDIRPAVHLKDWRVVTRITGDQAEIEIATELSGEGSVEVAAPKTLPLNELWSAESPKLHEVVFTVKDANGKATETIKEKVGFREIAWDNRELKVNGKRVWLKGVNHHDLCPCHGRAMTDAEQWRDVKMIKDGGMNFIRLCHYPPSTALLDACDELGVYVMDEVPFGFGDPLLKDPDFGEVLLERVRLTYARDKNRASVLLWSIGNENPVTPITIAAGRLMGTLDPTRPWTFPMIPGVFKKWVSGEDEQALQNPDIPLVYDWHYMSDKDIPEFTDKVDRPIIASEWGHAFGSETGEWEDTYKAMQGWQECHGGAIWMFQDQGIERPVEKATDSERLNSVWKTPAIIYDSHSIAGTDGLVYADRTPQTGWFQAVALFGGKTGKAGKPGIFRFSGTSGFSGNPAPSFALRFDRRMTITKRNTLASGEASRQKRDAALAKGKTWTPGRRDAGVKDLVSPRVQPAPEGAVKVAAQDGGYLVSYSLVREAAWDSAEAGVAFDCPAEMTEFRWAGLGPYEMYPKRDLLDDFGVWHLNKDDLYFPGNRSHVSAAIVCDKTGAGWLVLPTKDGETLNVAVEDTPDGRIRVCVNAFVCGIYHKRGWPDDMRHIEAGEKVAGAFRLVPLSADWPERLRTLFGAPDEPVKVTNPFYRNYDRSAD